MNQIRSSADKSGYYYETSSAHLARVDSAPLCGNLAYAMRNSTIIVRTIQPKRLTPLQGQRPTEAHNPGNTQKLDTQK